MTTTQIAAKRILMIEDNRLLAHAYLRQIEWSNYQMEWATNGVDGFRKFVQTNPDAILLDLFLPGVSGLDLLRRVREHELDRAIEIPVFIFTSGYSKSMEHEARLAGATRFFDKSRTSAVDILAELEVEWRKQRRVQNQGHGIPTLASDFVNNTVDAYSPKHTSLVELANTMERDDELQREIRKMLVSDSPEIVASLRSHVEVLRRGFSSDAANRSGVTNSLETLHRVIHNLIASSGFSGLLRLTQFCRRLDVLLVELLNAPLEINTSRLHTVDQAISVVIEWMSDFDSRPPEFKKFEALAVPLTPAEEAELAVKALMTAANP